MSRSTVARTSASPSTRGSKRRRCGKTLRYSRLWLPVTIWQYDSQNAPRVQLFYRIVILLMTERACPAASVSRATCSTASSNWVSSTRNASWMSTRCWPAASCCGPGAGGLDELTDRWHHVRGEALDGRSVVGAEHVAAGATGEGQPSGLVGRVPGVSGEEPAARPVPPIDVVEPPDGGGVAPHGEGRLVDHGAHRGQVVRLGIAHAGSQPSALAPVRRSIRCRYAPSRVSTRCAGAGPGCRPTTR